MKLSLLFLFIPIICFGQKAPKYVYPNSNESVSVIKPNEIDSIVFSNIEFGKNLAISHDFSFSKMQKLDNKPVYTYVRMIENIRCILNLIVKTNKSLWSIDIEYPENQYFYIINEIMNSGYSIRKGNTEEMNYKPKPGNWYLFNNTDKMLSCSVTVPLNFYESHKFTVSYAAIHD